MADNRCSGGTPFLFLNSKYILSRSVQEYSNFSSKTFPMKPEKNILKQLSYRYGSDAKDVYGFISSIY